MAVMVTVPLVWSTLNTEEFSSTARFSSFGVLSPTQNDAEITEISYGKAATITVDVEKLTQNEISDIMIKTGLEGSKNIRYLLISPATIHAGLSMSNEDYLRYDNPKYEKNPFPDGKTTGPIIISITVIDDPGKILEDTVKVSLYAEGIKMDEKSFKIRVLNSIT